MTGAPALIKEDGHLSYADPSAQKGGELKQSEIGTFDTVNPYSIKGKAASGLNLIYDKLMARSWDEPFTLYPLIAETVEMSEDRSQMVIHLNPKAAFNDGTPITADDVIFSYETLKEFGRPNMRQVYRQVSDISKIDSQSVRIIFGDNYNQETAMILAMMPVLSKDWWEGRDFEETLLEMPNSSGPYIIKDIQPGSKITYERNPNYWAENEFAQLGMNNFNIVSFDYYRDDTAALESFIKGDLNFRRENDPRRWTEKYDVEGVEKLEFEHGRPQPAEALIFNMRKDIFKDAKVRKALFYAFDGNWIKENFFQNNMKRTNSFFANSKLSANLAVPGAELTKRQRLQKAQQLLQEAGWQIQNNQLVKDGVTFKFEIIVNQAKYEKIVLSFVQSLQRLGIDASVRTLDSATFQNRLLDYDYDMALHKWQNSLSPGTEQMVYWSCKAAEEKGRFNYSGICNKDIDRIAESIANASTYEDLTANTKELDQILIESFIAIPLFYNNKDYIAVSENTIKAPDYTPIYGPVIEAWSQKQKAE